MTTALKHKRAFIPTIIRKASGRQVKDAEISMNMGWGTPAVGSALIMRR